MKLFDSMSGILNIRVFQDIYLEAKGYDMEVIKKERKEQKEIAKSKRIIIGITEKVFINIMGIVYMFIGSLTMYNYIRVKNLTGVFLYLLALILDVTAVVLCNIKTKKTEIIGLICIIVFIVFNFIIPMV